MSTAKGDFIMYNPQLTYQRIVQRCKDIKSSLSELNDKIGLSKDTINRAGKSNEGMKASNIYAISAELSCTSDYLLGLSDTPTASTAPTLTADEAELLSLFRALPYKLQQRYIGRMQESADDEARARKKDA